jgi:hypothetical protein
MQHAPIALFVFNRSKHTRKTLEALKADPLSTRSSLFVFCDGPKEDSSAEMMEQIKAVRELVGEQLWCKEVVIYESPVNKGLARSIVEGVSKMLESHEAIIVLEDDIVISPFFLKFMNLALDKYRTAENVACVSGYVYPIKPFGQSAFFIKGADCWGWATWARAWNILENNSSLLLEQLEKSNSLIEFDFSNSYAYSEMLKNKIEGKNNSWAINWYASAFLKNMLTLYPERSLVKNIGTDGSGTHFTTSGSEIFNTEFANEKTAYHFPEPIESDAGRRSFIDYFKATGVVPDAHHSFLYKLKRKIVTLLKLPK